MLVGATRWVFWLNVLAHCTCRRRCCCCRRYADTEDSDAVAAIWKQLSKQWGQLKSHSLKVGRALHSSSAASHTGCSDGFANCV